MTSPDATAAGIEVRFLSCPAFVIMLGKMNFAVKVDIEPSAFLPILANHFRQNG